MSITARKKILLHLPVFEENEDETDPSVTSAGFELCQEGIADVVNISQNRVSKLLSSFESQEIVKVEKKRFKSCPQKRKIYFLSEKGKKDANKIEEEIKQRSISIRTESGTDQIKLEEIGDYIKGKNDLLFALNNVDKDGCLDLTDIGEDDFFVDRKKEKIMLKEKMEEVNEEGCRLLLLTGPTGVGKTRLIEQMEEDVEPERFVFLKGACEKEAADPLYPFEKALLDVEENESVERDDLDIFDVSGLDIGYADDNTDANATDTLMKKNEFYHNILADFKKLGKKGSHVVFLDDLQLGDRINFWLLKFLTEDLQDEPILFVGTIEKEQIEDKEYLEIMDRCSSLQNSSTYSLKPFNWRGTRKMVIRKVGRRSIPDRFVDLCQRVSRGYPLFLEAYIDKMLKDGVLDPIQGKYPKSEKEVDSPPEIKDLIQDRLARLNEREREVLEISTIIEEEIPLDLLIGTVNGTEDEILTAIEELKRKNLLKRYIEDELTFFHPLIKRSLEEKMPEKKKKKLHKKIAENIEKDYTINIEDHHLELAKHYERAADLERAVEYYLKAGKKAESVHDNKRARESYQMVLDHCEDVAPSSIKRYDVMERLAEVEKNTGDFKKRGEYLQKAIKATDEKKDLQRLYRKMGENLRKIGDLKRALEHVEEALSFIPDKTTGSEEKKERCKTLKEMGMIYLRQHDHRRCEDIFEEIKNTSEEIGYRRGEGEALHYLGSIDIFRSNFEEAKKRLEKAIEIKKEIDDMGGLSRSYNNLGVIFRNTQEYDKALDYFENANRIKKEIGLDKGDPEALDNMGIIYYDKGELKKAIEHHKIALDIEEKMGNKNGIAATLDNIGVVMFEKGDLDEAIDRHERSLKLKKEVGNKNGIALSHFNLGKCYKEKGMFEEALDHINRSLDINEELECEQNRAYSLMWKGLVYVEKREAEKAEKYLNRALESFVRMEDSYGKGITLSYLGRLMMLKDTLEKAEKYLTHSRTIGRDFKDGRYYVINTRYLADYELICSEYENALDLIEEALSLSRDMGAVNQEGKCIRVLGKILSVDGDHERAETKFENALKIFEQVGSRTSQGKVLFDWGYMLLNLGEGEEGVEKLKEAEEVFSECGADGWCRTVETALGDRK